MARPEESYRGFRRNSFFGRAARGDRQIKYLREEVHILADEFKRRYKWFHRNLKTFW